MSYQRSQYPPWSWSSSRKASFVECRRKYFYNYYLAHNGWEFGADELSKTAYRLKNLTGIHLLLGSAVHEVAEYTCKIIDSSGKLPTEETLTDKVRFLLNEAWKESRQLTKDLSPWKASPKKYLFLYEFYYGYGISKDLIAKIKEKMQFSIKNLLTCKSIKELQEEGVEMRLLESMDTFELFGTPVYAVPDLVYKRADGKWVVVDWKTGKEDDAHAAQLNVYCMYLRDKMGVDVEDMIGRVEYLLTGNYRDVEVTKETFEETERDIKESIDEMKAALADPEENIPHDMYSYPLSESKRFCRWCNYYELCEEELSQDGG
ncbi:MAG: PD-(D/E)XK nuclease family protein [Elusimicrobia bacterium]|nr:PD-(D/E)XK nuclease family protein [Elusimicrobiota bacterium]